MDDSGDDSGDARVPGPTGTTSGGLGPPSGFATLRQRPAPVAQRPSRSFQGTPGLPPTDQPSPTPSVIVSLALPGNDFTSLLASATAGLWLFPHYCPIQPP